MARKKSPIDRRRIVIDGARELFGRYGFEKTTVDDIARHTGIGKGSVYLEFKTKEDILIAIIDEFAHQMHTYMDQFVSEARAPYLKSLGDMLFGLVMSIHETATSNIHTPEVMMLTHRKLMKEFSHHHQFKDSRFKSFVKKACKEGEISSSASAEEVVRLINLVTIPLLPPYLRKEPGDEEKIPTRKQLAADARLVIDVLISGIRSRYSKKKDKRMQK